MLGQDASLDPETAPETAPETSPEMAEVEVAETLADQSSILFRLVPGVWLPRLDGVVSLGAGFVQVGDQLDVDNIEATFNGEIDLQFENGMGMWFGGFDFETDNAGRFAGFGSFGPLAFGPGDPFRASFDLTSFAGEFHFGQYRPVGTDLRSERLVVRPLVGVRYVDVEQRLERTGVGSVVVDAEWYAVYTGVELRVWSGSPPAFAIGRRIGIEFMAGAGWAFGGDGGPMWQVRGGITLEVADDIGIVFGYRLLELDIEDGAYTFDAGLQGLFLGASIRF
ncbi:MAG: hypothetical protein HKN62_09360 [Phycisphaerales bacterium]|nr:hypothetical protein [Phycisphaerales bacterium]